MVRREGYLDSRNVMITSTSENTVKRKYNCIITLLLINITWY